MLKTLEKRTEKALSNEIGMVTQSLDATEQVYCATHGFVKAVWGHCEECVDQGCRDWDATRIAKTLIPSWVGLDVSNRTVIVAPVKDALDAVQAISRYKNADELILVVWDTLVTALDRGRIGPSWTLPENGSEDDSDFVTCARCGQDFRPTFGDERVCDECYRIENGPRW